MSWDPITRIVGSPRDPRGHRLREPQGREVLLDLDDLPRVRHLHEGDRPAGHALPDQPHLRHLRRQPLHDVGAVPEHGLRHLPAQARQLRLQPGGAADYMFDHAIYNDCMCNVDFCEQMVKDTNPSLLAKAEKTPSPHGDIHGYKTIADIMRALNPFTGEFYLETLQVARYTREMYCLFGGRHTHPSTIMPGGVQRGHHAPDVHGLLRAADALHGLLQAHRADARRHLRLLPPGAARLRHGRLPGDGPRVLGRVRRPGRA